jgi:hypothetical protein
MIETLGFLAFLMAILFVATMAPKPSSKDEKAPEPTAEKAPQPTAEKAKTTAESKDADR